MLKNHPTIRLGIYLTSIAVSVLAAVIAVAWPDYGAALVTVAGILNAAALGTASSNLTPHDTAPADDVDDYGVEDEPQHAA